MSLFSVWSNAVATALISNPNILSGAASAVTGAVNSATATFQSQVTASVTPASNAVTAASKLLPQLKMAVDLNNTGVVATIAAQIEAIPSMTNDVKIAALDLMVNTNDPVKMRAYYDELADTINADVITQNKISGALGVNIAPIF